MNYENELFLEISALLTGFNKTELLGTGMVDIYYNCVAKVPQNLFYSDKDKAANTINVGFFFREVSDIFENSKGNSEKILQAIANRLMPSSAYGGLAQSIVQLWYTGSWGGNVVSAQSYIEGLVWNVAETHPPGAKQPGFGSWSIAPLT